MTGLRTKKALTLVCKAWSSIATPLLYEEVIFRRMGQICAFKDTLVHSHDTGRNLAQLVRAIRIVDCIVLRHCSDAVLRSLWDILWRCSELTSFSYHPTSRLLYPFKVDRDPEIPSPREFNVDPRWILGFAVGSLGHPLKEALDRGMRVLDLDFSGVELTEWFVGPLYAMLSHASHLTTLILDSFEMENNKDEWLLSAPPLKFPVLETLHVRLEHQYLFCEWMSRCWQMPKLKSLTYQSEVDPVEFLKAHGAHIIYAYLGCGSHTLPQLSRLVPVIEHLTLPLHFELRELEIDSPTLRYLDILREGYPAFAHYRSISFVSYAQVPALKRIRLLGFGAWAIAAQYPELLSPELLAPDVDGPEAFQVRPGALNAEQHVAMKNPWNDWVSGGVIHCVHGEVLRQKWWGVAHDPWWCPDYVFLGLQSAFRGAEDSDSDGGSYIYESESSDTDSDGLDLEMPSDESDDAESSDTDSEVDLDSDLEMTSSESDDAESDATSSYGDPEIEQLDHETIVRMFRLGAGGDFMLADTQLDYESVHSDTSR